MKHLVLLLILARPNIQIQVSADLAGYQNAVSGAEECIISDDMDTQLKNEIHQLDQEIEHWRQKIYSEIATANAGVQKAVERSNLRALLAAGFNGIGGLFQIYSIAFGATALTIPILARLIGNPLRRGTQTALALRSLKPVEQSCGPSDYDAVIRDYAVFFHLKSLFAEYDYLDPVEYHPDVLKIMACEFQDQIKIKLSCLTQTSSGTNLNAAIDQMILAIRTRLDFTKKVQDFP